MNEWMWVIALAVLFLAGLGAGFLWGRSRTDEAQKAKELEARLRQAEEELKRYREQVAGHFATTAELMQKLTEDYRAVYRHLAESSQSLCGPDAPRLLMPGESPALENAKAPETEAARDSAPSQPQEASEHGQGGEPAEAAARSEEGSGTQTGETAIPPVPPRPESTAQEERPNEPRGPLH